MIFTVHILFLAFGALSNAHSPVMNNEGANGHKSNHVGNRYAIPAFQTYKESDTLPTFHVNINAEKEKSKLMHFWRSTGFW